MDEIIHYDKQLLLLLNGSDSVFLDWVVMTLTNAKTWIPLYLSLLYVVIKANRNLRGVLMIMGAAGLCVLLAGTVDDEIVKPLVARWRPGHDPEIGHLVDTVDNYRGGNYGFFSAHASNTFSIALFFSLLMRQRLLTIGLISWSLVNCWTRLYLGVHYPGDITVGLIWGALVAVFVYWLYCRMTVPARYDRQLTYIPIVVLMVTVVYAMLRSLILYC